MDAKEPNTFPLLKCVVLAGGSNGLRGERALRWSIQEGGLQNLNEILWRAPLRTLAGGGYLDGMAAWRSTIICIICSIMAMRRSI